MENMLHLAPSQALPTDRSIFLRDQLPPVISAVASLPVIDMSRSRDEVRRGILDAGMELGFFLVRMRWVHVKPPPATLMPHCLSNFVLFATPHVRSRTQV
jgi:hypothetical protein